MWPLLIAVFGAVMYGFFALMTGQYLEDPADTTARSLAQAVQIARSEGVLLAGKDHDLPSAQRFFKPGQMVPYPAGKSQGATITQYVPPSGGFLATYVTGLDCGLSQGYCTLAARLAEYTDGTITLYRVSGQTYRKAQVSTTNRDETAVPYAPETLALTNNSLVIYDRLK